MPTATSSPRTPVRAAKEAVLVGAVDLAREAAEELALPGQVGEHRGAVVEGERLVTHRFESLVPGYRGWHWAVTVARPPRGRVATVCEVELLPGEGALLAPEWLPWSERLRPGDVGPGDVLPYLDDDDRLEPGYQATGEDADELAIYELGLGRPRVLSAQGRSQVLTRWYDGDRGPEAPIAKAAAAPCSTCGFLIKLAGSPRTVFGVCANEWSPEDGRVVSMDHGCGAHSETHAPEAAPLWQTSPPVRDEMDLEVIATAAEPPASAGPVPSDQPSAEATADVPADQPTAEASADAPADLGAVVAGEDEAEAQADAVPDVTATAEQGEGPGGA